MSRAWKVRAREDDFVVVGANGDEMLQSVKEYASPASAERAARNFAEAMQGSVVLEREDADGNREELGTFGGDSPAPGPVAERAPRKRPQLIEAPVPGRDRFATNPAYLTS